MVSRSGIRVLIVDDSALMRQILTHIFEQDSRIAAVGQASDPFEAWRAIQNDPPDVITLDVEMPRMDGLTFLGKLMRRRPTPVVMISTLTRKGADVTLRALEAGALDFVPKPTANLSTGTVAQAAEIIDKVVGAAGVQLRKADARPHPTPRPTRTRTTPSPASAARIWDGLGGARPVRLVALGSSTGGTEALAQVIRDLTPPFPPVAVVQHMPSPFTATFARRLDALTDLEVVEAEPGMRLAPGRVVLAHGSYHLRIRRVGGLLSVHCGEDAPVSRHRPSVDVLFHSVAEALGREAMGVILTGMGRDGAAGLRRMRDAGAITLGQDESTSVVYGMPGAAMAEGAVQRELPLERVGTVLTALVHGSRARVAIDVS